MWIPPMVGANHEMLSNMNQWQALMVCAATIPCSLAIVHGTCWYHAMDSLVLPMASSELPQAHHMCISQVSMVQSKTKPIGAMVVQ
jgi:hypothetical protein